jgi:hypothetical protein
VRNLFYCISVMREPEPAVIVCSSEPQGPLEKRMPEPMLKFSVTCPDCALESVSEIPIAVIANSLLTGKSLRLYSNCHDRYWTATFVEREKLRKRLATLDVDTHANPTRLHSEDLAFAD